MDSYIVSIIFLYVCIGLPVDMEDLLSWLENEADGLRVDQNLES